jgi:hypothetical protein
MLSMLSGKVMNRALMALGLVLLEACGSDSGAQGASGGAGGHATNEGSGGGEADVEPVVNLDQLEGAWAAADASTLGVMPVHCRLLTEESLPPDARAMLAELSDEPMGRSYLEFEGNLARSYWWAYPDIQSCQGADFNQPGTKLIGEQTSLAHTPGVFEDDGEPVQEFRQSPVLEDGTIYYVLLKASAGTSEYRELLWSSTTRSRPFQKLSDNDGWWRFRQPR